MNLNKIFLIGNLTQDPEMRSTQTGQSITTLNMATNRAWTDKGGQKQTAAEFHRVVAWGRLGEIANQYLKKGSLVMIEGRIQTRSWTDQNNNKGYTTEVVAERLQLGPRTANATVSDIRPATNSQRQETKNDDIPIIDADDPISSGVEEDEVKIKEEDLPF